MNLLKRLSSICLVLTLISACATGCATKKPSITDGDNVSSGISFETSSDSFSQNDQSINSDSSSNQTSSDSSKTDNPTSKPASEESKNPGVSAPPVVPSTKPAKNKVKFHFINTNKLPFSNPTFTVTSDCILIQDGSVNTLIDAGMPNPISVNAVVSYLKAVGVKKVDNIIITHSHSDHIGGMPTIINQFDVGNVYAVEPTWSKCDQATKDDGFELYTRLKTNLSKKGKSITTVNKEGFKVAVSDESFFEIFGSSASNDNEMYADANHLSLGIKYTHKNIKGAFMGDATVLSEQKYMIGKFGECQILKAGHHGDQASSSQEFLNELKPQIAIFTNPMTERGFLGGRYVPVIDKLNALKAPIYTIGMNDNIILLSDGNSFKCSAKNAIK